MGENITDRINRLLTHHIIKKSVKQRDILEVCFARQKKHRIPAVNPLSLEFGNRVERVMLEQQNKVLNSESHTNAAAD